MRSFCIKRAVVSVWDKTGIATLASALVDKGVEIWSTGGTFSIIKKDGIQVSKIEKLTGFPEILNGRVKTLHPSIFAGILANRNNPSHLKDLESASILDFQLVIVNLYPFVETVKSGENDPKKIIEMIDIGGPSMLRAAAKNYENVVVLSHPDQYTEFQSRLENGNFDLDYRKGLAKSVFTLTLNYDYEISRYFSEPDGDEIPEHFLRAFQKVKSLRYGENPDQRAAIYAPVSEKEWSPFVVLQGKELSYNNYIDCLTAYRIISEIDELSCVIIKHSNPCGFGVGSSVLKAYTRAVKTDPVSYFGGIVGVNREVDKELAEELSKSFLECIVAPNFSEEALVILSRKKKLRLLIPRPSDLTMELDIKGYGTGLLVQDIQKGGYDKTDRQIVTDKQPDTEHERAIRWGWHLVKNVKSNAIVLSNSDGAVGIGAGQMSRIDSLKIALRKAEEAGTIVKNSIMASDAFFPFRDSVDLAAEHGVIGVVQPGGSIRDNEVIDACNEHNMFMIFTGKRVFKH